MTDVIIVCSDLGEDCWNCGGHRAALGGPFPGDDRFCSIDCATDHQEWAERAFAPDWCETCGYDRHEHAPDCVGGS